jgi:hypothetical protein
MSRVVSSVAEHSTADRNVVGSIPTLPLLLLKSFLIKSIAQEFNYFPSFILLRVNHRSSLILK